MPASAPLALALGVAVAALAAAALCLGAVAALRAADAWRSRRQARHEPAWRESLAQALEDPTDVPLAAIAPAELAAFLALWNRAHAAQEASRGDNLVALLRLHALDARVLRLLWRPSPRLRLIAITTLARLGERRAWKRLVELAARPDPVVSFAAARAAVGIDPPATLERLAAGFCARRDWPLTRVASLFEWLGPGAVTAPLVRMLRARPREGLDRAVRLARFGHRERIAPLVRDWLSTSNDPGVIVAALEYAQEAEDLPWARQSAEHAHWSVRAASAGALARAGGRTELPFLLALLRDPVWRVRYAASQAVIRLQGLSPLELDALRESERDAFAADMLAQALAEANLR